MSGSETNIVPDDVVTESARMASTSTELRELLTDLATQIRGIVHDEPWGQDEPGRACRRSLLGGGDGTDGNAVDNILDSSDAVCGHAYALAENVGVGAIETELEDQETAAEVRRVAGELLSHGVSPSLLLDEATVQQVNELQTMIDNPRVQALVGGEQVADIDSFLSDVEQLAE